MVRWGSTDGRSGAVAVVPAQARTSASPPRANARPSWTNAGTAAPPWMRGGSWVEEDRATRLSAPDQSTHYEGDVSECHALHQHRTHHVAGRPHYATTANALVHTSSSQASALVRDLIGPASGTLGGASVLVGPADQRRVATVWSCRQRCRSGDAATESARARAGTSGQREEGTGSVLAECTGRVSTSHRRVGGPCG